MAFIPIDAKADISSGEGSKKGKLTPAQHSQINAWSLTRKTGILNCLGKCEATSESYSVINNEASVTLKSGYFSICGRIVECEYGTVVTIPAPLSGEIKGRIVATFNLSAVQNNEFTVSAVGNRNTLVQEDLNENPVTGVYEFELYKYTATPTNVYLERTGEYIPDVEGKFEQFEASLKDEGKPLHGYDDSKGTIEERLTRLGFKSGVISFAGSNYGSLTNTDTASNGVFRQGNYVFGNITTNLAFTQSIGSKYFKVGATLFTLPDGFKPKREKTVSFACYENGSFFHGHVVAKIQTNGNAVIQRVLMSDLLNKTANIIFNFGFEGV